MLSGAEQRGGAVKGCGHLGARGSGVTTTTGRNGTMGLGANRGTSRCGARRGGTGACGGNRGTTRGRGTRTLWSKKRRGLALSETPTRYQDLGQSVPKMLEVERMESLL